MIKIPFPEVPGTSPQQPREEAGEDLEYGLLVHFQITLKDKEMIDLLGVLSAHLPTVISNIVNSYYQPPSMSTFKMSFPGPPVHLKCVYQITSLVRSSSSEELNPSDSLMESVIDTLCRSVHPKYRTENGSISSEGSMVVFEGGVIDPARDLMGRLEVDYRTPCSRCKKLFARSECDVCENCFSPSLDFKIEPRLLQEMNKLRREKEAETVDGSFRGSIMVSFADESKDDLDPEDEEECTFVLHLTDCTFSNVVRSK